MVIRHLDFYYFFCKNRNMVCFAVRLGLCIGVALACTSINAQQVVTPPNTKFFDQRFLPDPWPMTLIDYAQVFDVTPLAGPSSYLPRWIPGTDINFRRDVSFRYTSSTSTTFGFHVYRMISNLKIGIYVDNVFVDYVHEVGAPGVTTTLDKQYAISVPAGTHTVKLVNASNDWVELDKYRVYGYRSKTIKQVAVPLQRVQVTLSNWAEASSGNVPGWHVAAAIAPSSLGQSYTTCNFSVPGYSFQPTRTGQFSPVGEKVDLIEILSPSGSLLTQVKPKAVYTAQLNRVYWKNGVSSTPTPLTSAELNVYRRQDWAFDFSNPHVASWITTNQLTKGTGEDTMEFAMRVAHAMSDFTYVEYLGSPASEVARTKTGNCAGIGVLMGSALRKANIPARLQCGRYISDDPNYSSVDYHCRLQFWDSRFGWVSMEMPKMLNVVQDNDEIIGTNSGNLLFLTDGGIMVNEHLVGLQNNWIYPLNYGGNVNHFDSSSLVRLPLGHPPLSSLTLSANAVTGGSTVVGTVNLDMLTGQASGSEVLLSDNGSELSVPISVTIPFESQTASFSINTTSVVATVTRTITATLGGSQVTATLQIQAPKLTSLTITPTSIGGGGVAQGLVSLGASAAGSTSISLSKSGSEITIPNSVSVAAGQTSASFNVSTTAVSTTVTRSVTATREGVSKTATITILPFTMISAAITPANVVGGNNASETVRFSSPAPSGMSLTVRDNDSRTSVPATVEIPSGATEVTFPITSQGTSTQFTSNISVYLGSKSIVRPIVVYPPALSTFALSSTSVKGGEDITGTVSMNGKAFAGGVYMAGSSDGPEAIIPSSIGIPQGQTQRSFVIKTKVVSARVNRTLTVTYAGVTRTRTITINK